MKKKKISVCIPTFEYGGSGKDCLEYSFEKLKEQTFKNFNVIISDSSNDDEIEKLCKEWQTNFEIKYIKSPEARGNPAKNMNISMKNADGEWIKILCQDDYLSGKESLEKIARVIDTNKEYNWIATGYLHTNDKESFFNYHSPYLNPRIYIINTIGTPSCTAFKNDFPLMEMDENLSYCYDCEYYYRFFLEHGNPKLITDVTIISYLWEKSITSSITNDLIIQESRYILQKHGFSK